MNNLIEVITYKLENLVRVHQVFIFYVNSFVRTLIYTKKKLLRAKLNTNMSKVIKENEKLL